MKCPMLACSRRCDVRSCQCKPCDCEDCVDRRERASVVDFVDKIAQALKR